MADWNEVAGAYPAKLNPGNLTTEAIVRVGGGFVLPTSATGVVGIQLTSVCVGKRTYNAKITKSIQAKWVDGSVVIDNGVFYAEGFDNPRGIVIDGDRK